MYLLFTIFYHRISIKKNGYVLTSWFNLIALILQDWLNCINYEFPNNLQVFKILSFKNLSYDFQY